MPLPRGRVKRSLRLPYLIRRIGTASAQTLDPGHLRLNWVAEAEHGGFYQPSPTARTASTVRRDHPSGRPERQQQDATARRQDRLLSERQHAARF